MILEGIVTTINEDGSTNISPMGPAVDESMSHLLLKPYQTSRTYNNLKRHGEGVLHVTDDVELLARAAVSQLDTHPVLQPAVEVKGKVLKDACRWYEFRVTNLDDSHERTRIDCQVVHRQRRRDFFGFNRAKHAVVEAAILATRTEFLPADEILREFGRLSVIVDKTGGEQEHRAFQFLDAFVRDALKEKV